MDEDGYKKDFCDRLRTVVGSNASEFARTINITPQRMHNYLSGVALPPLLMLAAIIKKSGVDARWLLTGESTPPKLLPADMAAVPTAELFGEAMKRLAGAVETINLVKHETAEITAKLGQVRRLEIGGEHSEQN